MFVSYLFSEFLFFKKQSGFIVLRGLSNNNLQSEFPESCLKLDDLYFINGNTGWVIRGIDSVKKVYKSSNGGDNWFVVFENNHNVFRSIVFKDSLKGFIGTLDKDVLLETSDGGKTWMKVKNFIGEKPKGICGLYKLDSLNIFGCGRYDKPAYFIKTTDGGLSWSSSNLSSNASLLVDCYFFNKNEGILAGGQSVDNYRNAYPLALYTSDGGISWNKSYIGDSKGEILWKIYFINSLTGYISIQTFRRYGESIKYLKTTDGGKNWAEKFVPVIAGYYEELAIVFLNENSGIVGGLRYLDNGKVEGESYFTSDSGNSWISDSRYQNLNRIKIINNKIFATGKSFYKIKFP